MIKTCGATSTVVHHARGTINNPPWHEREREGGVRGGRGRDRKLSRAKGGIKRGIASRAPVWLSHQICIILIITLRQFPLSRIYVTDFASYRCLSTPFSSTEYYLDCACSLEHTYMHTEKHRRNTNRLITCSGDGPVEVPGRMLFLSASCHRPNCTGARGQGSDVCGHKSISKYTTPWCPVSGFTQSCRWRPQLASAWSRCASSPREQLL